MIKNKQSMFQVFNEKMTWNWSYVKYTYRSPYRLYGPMFRESVELAVIENSRSSSGLNKVFS